MKAIYLILFCLTISWAAFAQAPDWSVTPSDYTYTMSLVVTANDECTEVAAANYRIGIFDKMGVCRGFSDLFMTSAGFRGFPTVYSNTINEELYYRIYDAAENEVFLSYLTRLEFLAEAVQGKVSDPIRAFYDSAPAVDAGPDQIVSDATSTTLAATGTAGVWLVMYGEGGSFEDQSSPTTRFFGQAGESYQLVWTVTDAVCLNEMDHVFITFTADCQVSLSFDDNVVESSTPSYAASETIISQADIESSANVSYQAGQSITLSPGFHAKSGSQFRASIASCSSSREEVIENRNEIFSDVELTIYPNPASDFLTIQFTTTSVPVAELSLYDSNGQVVQQWAEKDLSANTRRTISTDFLNAGFYFLQIRQGAKMNRHKLLIIR
ncbi:MAG: T9SS type A sorting domain-containing protein [Bacteroidota bacterium]